MRGGDSGAGADPGQGAPRRRDPASGERPIGERGRRGLPARVRASGGPSAAGSGCGAPGACRPLGAAGARAGAARRLRERGGGRGARRGRRGGPQRGRGAGSWAGVPAEAAGAHRGGAQRPPRARSAWLGVGWLLRSQEGALGASGGDADDTRAGRGAGDTQGAAEAQVTPRGQDRVGGAGRRGHAGVRGSAEPGGHGDSGSLCAGAAATGVARRP